MLYRPNFCCQCGEKIARARWTLLTSRRFCEFCEVEQKEYDLVPRAVAILAIVVGVAGFTAYLGAGEKVSTSADSTGSTRTVHAKPKQPQQTVTSNSSATPLPQAPRSQQQHPVASGSQPDSMQRQAPPNSSTEPVYYCGAMTRKGTPCTRRVKVPGRCWQHGGEKTTQKGLD